MPVRGQSSEPGPNQQNQNPPARQNQGSAGQQSQSPAKPAENQNSKPAANSPQELPDKVQPTEKKNDRMFYVMPNYLTVDNQSQVPSINWKEKFSITLKGDRGCCGWHPAGEGCLSGIRTGSGGIWQEVWSGFR